MSTVAAPRALWYCYGSPIAFGLAVAAVFGSAAVLIFKPVGALP